VQQSFQQHHHDQQWLSPERKKMASAAAAKERWLDRHRQLARQEALLEQGE
jgi:hypothetical protein